MYLTLHVRLNTTTCLLVTDFEVDNDISEQEIRRNLLDRLPPILSSLLRDHLLPPWAINPVVLHWICHRATTLASQLVASGNGITSPQPHVNAISSRLFEEANPYNSHSLAHLGSNMVQPQGEMNGHPFPNHHCPTSQGYPVIYQAGASVEPNIYYQNMVSTGPNIPYNYQTPFSEQPDEDFPGATFDRAFAEVHDLVDQNTCPWSNPI